MPYPKCRADLQAGHGLPRGVDDSRDSEGDRDAGGDLLCRRILPAPELFPTQAMARAFYQVLSEEGPSALQYSTTEGFASLRQWIAERMGSRGLRTTQQEIMITRAVLSRGSIW